MSRTEVYSRFKEYVRAAALKSAQSFSSYKRGSVSCGFELVVRVIR